MWRKNLHFLSCLQVTRHIKAVKRESDIIRSTSRCCCMNQCLGSNLHTSSSLKQHEHQRGHRSRSQIAVLTALGVSFTTYMLWNKKQKPSVEYTSENPSPDQAANNPSADNDTDEQKDESKNEIDWSLIPDIPGHVPYLLIGSGIAAIEAFKAIKTKDMNAKVLMIGEEDYMPYWRPPLSKHFWFDENKESYKDFEYTNSRGKKSSVFLLPGIFMEPKKLPYSDRGGLALLKSTKVVQLDSVNKNVVLDNGAKISFDKCLIATGGKPKNDAVLEKAGVDVINRTTLFRNYSDLWKLSEICQSVGSVAVIGGGFLGCELAVGLNFKGYDSGLKVYQVLPEKGIMAKVLPGYLSEWATDKMRKEGVDVKTSVSIKSAVYENGKVKLGLSNGQYLNVDHLVVAVGIEPNTDLAASGKLEIDDKFGGFRVNSELQAQTDIWAAGDCASFYDPKLGRHRVEHFEHASITGRQAGFNMTGENRPYLQQSMFWSTVTGVADYEGVGLVDSSLETFSVFSKSYPKEEESNEDAEEPKDDPEKNKVNVEKNDSSESETLQDDYNHGVIFYLRDGAVVGVVLWNFPGLFERLDIAKQVIADGAKGQDLIEVAKLFNIYAV